MKTVLVDLKSLMGDKNEQAVILLQKLKQNKTKQTLAVYYPSFSCCGKK